MDFGGDSKFDLLVANGGGASDRSFLPKNRDGKDAQGHPVDAASISFG